MDHIDEILCNSIYNLILQNQHMMIIWKPRHFITLTQKTCHISSDIKRFRWMISEVLLVWHNLRFEVFTWFLDPVWKRNPGKPNLKQACIYYFSEKEICSSMMGHQVLWFCFVLGCFFFLFFVFALYIHTFHPSSQKNAIFSCDYYDALHVWSW